MDKILANFKEAIEGGIRRSKLRRAYEDAFGEDPEDMFGPDWENYLMDLLDNHDCHSSPEDSCGCQKLGGEA